MILNMKRLRKKKNFTHLTQTRNPKHLKTNRHTKKTMNISLNLDALGYGYADELTQKKMKTRNKKILYSLALMRT